MQHATDRLTLRPPTLADRDGLFAIYGDPATQRFNPGGPLVSLEQASALLERWLEHWAQRGYGQWAIATRTDTQRVIGFGGIDGRDYLHQQRLNLGYRFAVQAWGQGYATELGAYALKHAFDQLQVKEVFALVRPTHLASIRVLEKIGMRQVGLLDDVPGQMPSRVYAAERETHGARLGQALAARQASKSS